MELKPFKLNDLCLDSFYYIIHVLDEVLVGEIYDARAKGKEQFHRLANLFDQDIVLEAHFFNEQQEIFVAREHDQLIKYKPLLHEEGDRIERCYWLEEERWGKYKQLTVMEYIAYDEEDHFAYVERSVLYRLM